MQGDYWVKARERIPFLYFDLISSQLRVGNRFILTDKQWHSLHRQDLTVEVCADYRAKDITIWVSNDTRRKILKYINLIQVTP